VSTAEQQELAQRGEVTAVRVHQETGRESRIYHLEFTDGVQVWPVPLWSVTTLLKIIDRPALQSWAATETAKAAFANLKYLAQDLERHGEREAVYQLAQARFKKKSRAGDIGDGVHALIEAHIKGAEPPHTDPDLADDILPRFEKFLRWEEQYQPTYRQSEATVFHPEHGWAGTLDFIAQIGDLGEVLVDVKNTNPGGRKKDEPGVYLEHALQVAAYAHAREVAAVRGIYIEPVPMPAVDHGAVLWLHPAFPPALVRVSIDEQEYTAFRTAAQLYRYKDGPGKKAIRGLVTPAAAGVLPTMDQQAEALRAQGVQVPVINEAQRKRMLKLGANAGMDHAAVKALVEEMTGATSTTKLPLARYEAVCTVLEARAADSA
jgi:hypothetical protein